LTQGQKDAIAINPALLSFWSLFGMMGANAQKSAKAENLIYGHKNMVAGKKNIIIGENNILGTPQLFEAVKSGQPTPVQPSTPAPAQPNNTVKSIDSA
jgi:hypothetical protein